MQQKPPRQKHDLEMLRLRLCMMAKPSPVMKKANTRRHWLFYWSQYECTANLIYGMKKQQALFKRDVAFGDNVTGPIVLLFDFFGELFWRIA